MWVPTLTNTSNVSGGARHKPTTRHGMSRTKRRRGRDVSYTKVRKWNRATIKHELARTTQQLESYLHESSIKRNKKFEWRALSVRDGWTKCHTIYVRHSSPLRWWLVCMCVWREGERKIVCIYAYTYKVSKIAEKCAFIGWFFETLHIP